MITENSRTFANGRYLFVNNDAYNEIISRPTIINANEFKQKYVHCQVGPTNVEYITCLSKKHRPIQIAFFITRRSFTHYRESS